VSPVLRSPALRVEFDSSGPPLALVQPDPIRVMIADAHPVVRAGFTAMMESEPGIDIAGAAGSAQEAIALASEIQPDVALVDLDLPDLGGIEAARRIYDDPGSSDVNLVILASHDSDEDLFAALRVGASGFVLKSTEPAELVRAVQLVGAGEALLSPSATRRLVAQFRSQPQPQVPSPEQFEKLTAREREVIALVAAGLRNDEIAQRLQISPATVKTHVSRALRKLDARDRSQLVAIAYQLGLVSLGARRGLRGLETRKSGPFREISVPSIPWHRQPVAEKLRVCSEEDCQRPAGPLGYCPRHD
jgi:DNA-binding NarL/FixJ family response regulator